MREKMQGLQGQGSSGPTCSGGDDALGEDLGERSSGCAFRERFEARPGSGSCPREALSEGVARSAAVSFDRSARQRIVQE